MFFFEAILLSINCNLALVVTNYVDDVDTSISTFLIISTNFRNNKYVQFARRFSLANILFFL